jgi:hypothetical protein
MMLGSAPIVVSDGLIEVPEGTEPLDLGTIRLRAPGK